MPLLCALAIAESPVADVVNTAAARAGDDTAPAWATEARRALHTYRRLVRYWVERVADDTSLGYFAAGGGWNDDVELSQSLAAYWLLTGDRPLRALFKDLAARLRQAPYQGAKPAPWTLPGDRRIEQGYSTAMLDVDHSAEETTLVFPRLFYVDFGAPTVIELATRLIWNLHDDMHQTHAGERNWGQWVATGLLMRSPRFNARYLDWCWSALEPPRCFESQDAVNNFRALAPGLSLAWYYGPNHYFWRRGQHGFLHAHHRAWIEATRTAVGDKPVMVPPAKILLDSLGFGDWTINDARPDGRGSGWSQGAWVFRHFYSAMIANELLFGADADAVRRRYAGLAAEITGAAFADRQHGRRVPGAGTSWALDRQFMQWRAEHGATADDEVFLSRRAGQSADTRAMAYLVLSERGEHARALGQATRAYRDIADHLASRIDDWTTGLEAGRTGLTDQVKFAFSDALVTLALGGGGIYDGAYPTMYFSLTDTDAEVVSLVGTRTPSAVEFWLYNFSARRTVGVCLWRLPDGAGTLSFGPDTDQDGVFDRPPVERVLPRIRRGDRVPLSIPARTLQLVRVETTRPEVRDRSLLPDPAAAVADVRLPGDAVEVVVHNIGLAATGEFKVRLLDRGGQPLGGDRRLSLPGFTGMAPVTGRVRWQGVGADRVGWAVLDPDDRLEEVTEHNNRVPLPGVADHRPDRCQ